jgi:class 3 adenylate cyclase
LRNLVHVAKLAAAARASLPDSAFAHIDAKGRRSLPIYDEAHVRNALARFNQVRFDDDAARERARTRLLKAAKRHGIVPVGFISGQLRSERQLGQVQGVPVVLPTGFVTMMLTDIEGSTALLETLGDAYGALLDDVRHIMRGAAHEHGGAVVEARADELFAVFERADCALESAAAIQRALRARAWPGASRVKVRIGLHSGYPTPTGDNYIGMPVHIAARISAAAHGGQVIVSGATRQAVRGAGMRFRELGSFKLRGIREPQALYQLLGNGTGGTFPPPRV